MSIELEVRIAAFDWLKEQVNIHGEVLQRDLLMRGFEFKGNQIHLLSPQQGIFKPKILEFPISIMTSPSNPYNDLINIDELFKDDATIEYRYHGDNPNRWDNVALRNAGKNNISLIYFLGIAPSRYWAFWPVFIINDEPKRLTFTVSINQSEIISPIYSEVSEAKKSYGLSIVKTRAHQRFFREKVIAAYKTRCAFCRLKHIELLDAAHIIPDKEPESTSKVDNGLSLCKIHHSAYDKYFIGVTPDFKIHVREDILEEEDGPMLQHGLKDLHKTKILLPTNKILRPNPDNLHWKYQKFKSAI